MNRKILLVEPNYKNKYPPMGLMKLATYYRLQGDDVRFFKGNLKHFSVQLICEDLINHLNIRFKGIEWNKYFPIFFNYIKTGSKSILEQTDLANDETIVDILELYRSKYYHKEYFTRPRFDKVGITTMFTFYWTKTIDTINYAKQFCKNQDDVMVGGVLASLVPEEVYKATGIWPHIGLLDKPGIIDKDSDLIIDELPLDYSILYETDYVYPAKNAYFAYMTRGCINRCKFCAVPLLEPQYQGYISLIDRVKATNKRFGEKQNLLLLDNNVLASESFDKIIDEIKECGFEKGATYTPPNQYDLMIKNLEDSFNDRAFVRRAIDLYKQLMQKIKDPDIKQEFYDRLKSSGCLTKETATKKAIFDLDPFVRPLYEKYVITRPRKRIVDFNQGLDSRLINDQNMEKLSEINISPLRIAFDHWSLRSVYEKSIRIASKHGITNLSNYLLYNYTDTPEELYYRLKLNIDLCEELDINIYSFPMKYHPIHDKKYFSNRNFVGKNWNKKFIRAIQTILNSTRGKVGKNRSFFEAAFGANVEEYKRILWMPEEFIMFRREYDEDLRLQLIDKYDNDCQSGNNLANEWWFDFKNLPLKKLRTAKEIISKNDFNHDMYTGDSQIDKVLRYYEIKS